MSTNVLPFPGAAADRAAPLPRPVTLSQLGDRESVSRLSPAAACIAPALDALGLANRWSELVEAFPEEPHAFGLPELRGVLWNLGVGTDRLAGTPDPGSLGERPVLLDTDRAGLALLTPGADGRIRYESPVAATTRDVWPHELPSGTAYALSDRRSPQGSTRETGRSGSWVGSILLRFRPYAFELAATSLLINLVAVLPSLFVMAVYDQVIGAQYSDNLPFLLSGLVAALTAEFGLRWIRTCSVARIAARIDYLVSTELFKHVMQLPPVTVEKASLWARVNQLQQFDGIKEFMSGPNVLLLAEVPFLVVYLAVLTMIGGSLVLAPLGMLAAMFALGLVFRHVMGGRMDAATHRYRRNQMVFEMLFGIDDIRAVGAQRGWMRDIARENAEGMRAKRDEARQTTVMSALGNFIAMSGGIATLAYGAHLVIEEAITVGVVIAAMILVWRIAAPAQSLLALAPRVDSLLASIRRVDALMDVPAEVRSSSGRYVHEKPAGGLRLKNVSFRYGPDEPPAISGLSLEIAPGDFAVLTGYTGAGKSTLLKLVTRMYQPQAGALYIDGIDARQIDPIALRQLISYLPHEARMFTGTIADNLRLNQPTASDADLAAAARDAGILDQILATPRQFDTLIDSRTSSGLSSSLRYGLCLARAYLGNRPILLLDEPGAYLDREADERLIESLAARRGKQTIVLATHRPSHMRLANRVFVLDDGVLRTG